MQRTGTSNFLFKIYLGRCPGSGVIIVLRSVHSIYMSFFGARKRPGANFPVTSFNNIKILLFLSKNVKELKPEKYLNFFA
jgi:hypothetical protein